MSACEQTSGLSVLDHGRQVHAYYLDLRQHLKAGAPLQYEWRKPAWLTPKLLNHQHNPDIMAWYQVYHDCGKPFCLEIDDEGRRHFPDHARISEQVAHQYRLPEMACRLIGRDMEIHLVKDVGIQSFIAKGCAQDTFSLLLTGLAEIHANAVMFGGLDSVSFKQKFKQINKRGKKLCKLLPD